MRKDKEAEIFRWAHAHAHTHTHREKERERERESNLLSSESFRKRASGCVFHDQGGIKPP